MQPRKEIVTEIHAYAGVFDDKPLNFSGLAGILKVPSWTPALIIDGELQAQRASLRCFDDQNIGWLSWPLSIFGPISPLFLSSIASTGLERIGARNFLDYTAEFWKHRTGKSMSSEQAREAAANVVGFIQTLARWEKNAEQPS